MHPTARRLLLSPFPLFVAVTAFLLVVHEPWRDEAQPWLIVRDAQPGFWAELDSEGSPGLWYALLWPLVKLDLPFFSARLLHAALACAAVALALLHAPFSRLEKWLFAFGYFVLYEYNAVTRSYVVLVLLLFTLAWLWAQRHARPWRHGLLLALLANVTAHGALIAMVLGAHYGAELLLRRERAWRPYAAMAPAVLGVLLAALAMLPRPDLAAWRTDAYTEWAQWHFVEAARGAVHAFLPVPPAEWVWGGTAFDALPPERLLWVGVAVYAASLVPFLRAPRVLLIYLPASLMLLAVYYLKHGVSGQMRHHGILFALFLFCFWLARAERAARPPPATRPRVRLRRGGAVVFALVLLAHVAASVPAVVTDARKPFSGAPDAAAWLRENGYADDDTLVAAYPSFIAASVLAHAPEVERAHFPQVDAFGSYVRWTHEDAASFNNLPVDAMVTRTDAAAASVNATRTVLLLSFVLDDPWWNERYERVAGYDSISPGDAVHVYVRR